MKTQTESTNWGQVYLYYELIGEAVFDLQMNNSYTCLFLNYVIKGKVIFYLK